MFRLQNMSISILLSLLSLSQSLSFLFANDIANLEQMENRLFI